ncbi:MAG TPA: hypothetical protein VF618_20510 [Thermoanaerobaculia bacterium]
MHQPGRLVAFATFAVYLALTLLAARPVTDPDLWWHVATGELILDSGTLPRTDAWSYTVPGARWLNHEWLAQIGMASATRAGGLALLFLLAAALIATAFALVHVRLLRRGTPPLAATLLIAAAFSLSIPVWGARPQILTLVMLALWLLLVDRFLERDAPSLAWLVFPLVIMLWSNLHGGYAAGIGFMGLAAVGAWLDGERRRAALMLAWSIPSLLAAAIHPLGWRQLVYPLEFLRENPWTATIVEWKKPAFTSGAFLLFELVLLASIVLAARVRETKPAWRDLLVFLAATHLALNHGRHVAVWGIVAIPIIGTWLPGAARTAWPRVAAIAALVIALVLAPFVIVTQEAIAANVVAQQPVAATAALGSLGPNVRLFTQYHWAGYVLWRTEGRVRVFVDSRADTVYPAHIARDYDAVMSADPRALRVLADSGTNAVLLPPDAFIAGVLQQQGWRVVHRDAVAVVLAR